MKIRISQSGLMRGINVVQKAVPSISVMPILKGILLIAEDDSVKLVANDMQIGIETELDAEVIEPGSVVIDSKIFGDIVRKIKDEYLEIIVDKKLSINIKCKNLDMKLVGFSGSDFPQIPKVKEENIIAISENTLNEMINQTVFAVAKSEHLQVITGQLIELKEKEITMAATDGYRFALRKQYYDNDQCKSSRIIIPGDSLKEIKKLLSTDSEREIKVALEEKHALFIIDNTKVVTRLLQGDYINTDIVMPKSYETKMKLKTRELLDALEITSIFAENSNSGVILRITDDSLKVSSRADIGSIVKEVDIELEGEDLEIGFNIRYLIEGLRVIDAEEIVFSFSKGSNSPGVIKPISDVKYEYLILPVRINTYNSN